MGESDDVAHDFHDAGGLGAPEARPRALLVGRSDQDGHGRLRKCRGVEGRLVGRGIQGGEPGVDQAVEATRDLERLGCRPISATLQRATELEGVERRPARDRVEPFEDRAREVETEARAQEGIGLVHRERPQVEPGEPIRWNRFEPGR